MTQTILDILLSKFPDFFNRNEDSNFFKSQSVTANQLQKLDQAIFSISESLGLNKRCWIWKEQITKFDYSIHFFANYPNIKSVKCYQNDYIIYTEAYNIEEEQNTFNYIYNSSTEIDTETQIQPIIPQDTFKIEVETYDGKIITKGFPENDEILNNIYDHDTSLDEIGALNNIPRKTYIPTTDYEHTEPHYNDRLSEDDYHYMKRIIEYNLRLHDTPLPILEIWKLYGLDATMLNRERYLLKLFDINRHPHDEDGHSLEWTPQVWEHQDGFSDVCEINFGKYFFVAANTTFPPKGTGCTFYFKLLNNIAAEIEEDFTVNISLNNELIVEGYSEKSYYVEPDILDDLDPNFFTISCYTQELGLIGTVIIEINVQGCSNADIYVASDGDDTTGDGTTNTPYQTLTRAMQDLTDVKTVIAVRGTVNSTQTLIVNNNCTIIGCNLGPGNYGTIENNNSPRIFDIVGNKEITLTLVDMRLKYGSAIEYVDNSKFNNQNLQFSKYLSVIVHGGTPTLEFSTNKSSYYYDYDNIIITGTFKSKTVGIPNTDLQIELLGHKYTVTTNNDGEFSKTITIRNKDAGSADITISSKATEYIEATSTTHTIQLNRTAQAIENTYGSSVTLTADGFTPGASVNLYTENTLITTVTADEEGEINYIYTPTFGSVAVYTSNDGLDIEYEWIIKTSLTITDLPFDYLITDITIDSETTDAYIIRTPVSDFSTISDLTGVVLDVSVADDGDITLYRFKSNYEDDETILEGDILYPEDADEILASLQDLTITEDLDLIATYGVDES